MATDGIKKKGTAKAYKADGGGQSTLISEPVIGIVKSNIDPTRSGKIYVYVAKYGGSDPNKISGWLPVSYLSPYIGISSASKNDASGNGSFVGNPVSYGFWASSPDIGTEVVCIFVNGNPQQGYYIGCVPKVGQLSMVPAMGASSKVVPNDAEATTYGGADRLPTSEVNYSNPNVKKSAQIYNEPKAVHSYQTSILSKQGLLRDSIRGVIGSSAQRESPSRVFGISTPGGPIFEGGYSAATVGAAIKNGDATKLKQIGRTGGHSFVMDDGSLSGKDQLIRLRSSAGHQITMSDDGQTIFIIHSNGQSWIEMGKEGTIDMYATNSFNVRSSGDINFHSDRDINLHAKRNVNTYAGENIKSEAVKDFSQRAGGAWAGYSVGAYTFKTDASMGLTSGGDAGLTAGGSAFVTGKPVNLNTGSGPSASVVPTMSKTSHIETTYSGTVGWMNPGQSSLDSITTRAPTHQPWVGSGKGIDVQVNATAPSPSQQTTASVDAANTAASAPPANPVSLAEVKAAPIPNDTKNLSAPTSQALTAQVATNAQAMSATAQAKAGVISTVTGVTAKQLESAGSLIPGAGAQATALMAAGMPAAKALEGQLTGAVGTTSASSLVSDITAQKNAVQSVLSNAADSLKSSGILTGKESGAQSGGPILAAATFGAGLVTKALSAGQAALTSAFSSTSLTGAAGSLKDTLSAGKLAGGTADGAGPFAGLATSLGGLASKAGDGLKSGLQSAFSAVESSFTALKGGVVNALGPKSTATPTELSAASKAGQSLESAKASLKTAEEALLVAKKEYRASDSEENATKLKAAEKAVADASQKVAQGSKSFLTSSTESIKSALSGINTSSLTSGLNALPGGAGAMMAMVSTKGGATTNPMASIMSSVKSAANSIPGLSGTTTSSTPSLSSISSLAGDVMGKASKAISSTLSGATSSLTASGTSSITGVTSSLTASANSLTASATSAMNSAKTAAAGMMGQLQTTLASIGTAAGQLKPPVVADGTFDKAAITAKTGALLGDPKIPQPVFGEDAAPASADADASVNAQTKALAAVTDAKAAVSIAELKLGETYNGLASGALADAASVAKLKEQQATLDKAIEALTAAQVKYESTVSA